MSKISYRLSEYVLVMLCFSTLFLNGCILQIPKLSKSDNSATKKDKVKTDKPFVINNDFSNNKAAETDDMSFTKVNEAENKQSFVLGKGYLSDDSTKEMEAADRVEGQKVLEKIKKLELRLKAEEKEREKTSIQVKKLNKKISDLQEAKESIEKDFTDAKRALDEQNKDMSTKINGDNTITAKPGAGYLSEGSTIGLGIIDGDDELKVIKKVKRLEARLEAERNKVNVLSEKLTALKMAKESVEKDFANTKKELEEKNNNLLEKINSLESKLAETESRAIAAEQELNPIKKELLKTQISETKAQQELYKLKIENLKQDEE